MTSNLENHIRKISTLGKDIAEDQDGIAFKIKYGTQIFQVIASWGEGWDHVSISLEHRTPTWSEMDYLKNLIFGPDQLVIQYHVPRKDHVNIHTHYLHLWQPQKAKIPVPPAYMV